MDMHDVDPARAAYLWDQAMRRATNKDTADPEALTRHIVAVTRAADGSDTETEMDNPLPYGFGMTENFGPVPGCVGAHHRLPKDSDSIVFTGMVVLVGVLLVLIGCGLIG